MVNFNEFYKAMIEKMNEKTSEKGETWKDDFAIYDVFHRYSSEPPSYRKMPIEKWLRNRLSDEISEYWTNLDESELIDIANYCAMLWTRKKVPIDQW